MEVSKRPKAAGLSIKVEGIKGPIVDGELPKAKISGGEWQIGLKRGRTR